MCARHCEKRSDEAIQAHGTVPPPWIATPPSGGSRWRRACFALHRVRVL